MKKRALKNIGRNIRAKWLKLGVVLSVIPLNALAAPGDNPWGGGAAAVDPSTLQTTLGTEVGSGLKLACIIVGTFLVMGGAGNCLRLMTRSAKDREEHGSALTAGAISAIFIVFGFVLIGLAFKGIGGIGK